MEGSQESESNDLLLGFLSLGMELKICLFCLFFVRKHLYKNVILFMLNINKKGQFNSHVSGNTSLWGL